MSSPANVLDDCPFPVVAEALHPYIKTRQDATRIRQALHSTLPLSPLHTPHSLLPESVDPSALTGVRKAYWRALEAHQAAQAKYELLKTELDQLLHQPAETVQSTVSIDDDPSTLVENYIPLLRQREKLRKLTVVDKTSAKIQVTGGDSVTDSFDKVVKRAVGELPAPPTTSNFERENGIYPEFDLTDLKQAILSTQQQIDEHDTFVRDIDDHGMTVNDPNAELRGLQNAHNELTSWMETQLALISNVNGPKGGEKVNGVSPEANGHDSDPSDEIETLYESYLESRQRLLSTVSKHTSSNAEETARPNDQRRGSENLEIEQRVTTSEVLLPYLPVLVAVKEKEQDLLHQGSYTRRQLASAEAQTQSVLDRLADESHLVEPGSSRQAPKGKDWRKAAETTADSTNKSAMQRLQSGKAHAEAATVALDTIRGLPASLDHFLA